MDCHFRCSDRLLCARYLPDRQRIGGSHTDEADTPGFRRYLSWLKLLNHIKALAHQTACSPSSRSSCNNNGEMALDQFCGAFLCAHGVGQQRGSLAATPLTRTPIGISLRWRKTMAFQPKRLIATMKGHECLSCGTTYPRSLAFSTRQSVAFQPWASSTQCGLGKFL